MDSDKSQQEVESREKLIQMFLIVGGFIISIQSTELNILVKPFTILLLFGLCYYIMLTRTKQWLSIDILVIFFSISYAIFLTSFIEVSAVETISPIKTNYLKIMFAVLFFYSLLSPQNSEKLNLKYDLFKEKVDSKKIYLGIISSILLIFILGTWYIFNYL
ncbi:hypothetical protein [Methanococcoides seepicolus]|nr:hypothetical protein [Methanococcoides seepicolus]